MKKKYFQKILKNVRQNIISQKSQRTPDNAGNGDWRHNTNRTCSCELKQHSHKFIKKNVTSGKNLKTKTKFYSLYSI